MQSSQHNTHPEQRVAEIEVVGVQVKILEEVVRVRLRQVASVDVELQRASVSEGYLRDPGY